MARPYGQTIRRNCKRSRYWNFFFTRSSNQLGLLSFISTPEYISPKEFCLEKFLIYLWASCDTYHEIAAAGEGGFRHFQKPDLEDEAVITRMYQLYLGTVHLEPSVAQFRACASTPVKVKILTMALSKSKVAANMDRQFMKVVFDAVFGECLSRRTRANMQKAVM